MRLPPSENLSTETLARVFRNTTNSYKFYWFLCILSHVSEHQKPQICIQDLLAQMVAKIWYPVNYFYISFGKQDRLGQVAEGIKLACGLANDVKADEIILATEAFVKEPSNDVTKALSTLARYVPYRFLRPWFTAELRGLPDHVINPKIRELAMARFNSEIVPCLYKFSGQAATIEIHPRWHDYLLRNNRILQDFCLWNLADYLEKRNPNVPSVGKKLFKPSHRNLVQAKNFWDTVFGSSSIKCIYSDVPLTSDVYSVDHFIPWRFVTHDLLWNLVPTKQEINSRKGDSIPSLETYLEKFLRNQHSAFRIVYEKGKTRLLEDYVNLFQADLETIYSTEIGDFCQRLEATIRPLEQIAGNQGFDTEWQLN